MASHFLNLTNFIFLQGITFHQSFDNVMYKPFNYFCKIALLLLSFSFHLGSSRAAADVSCSVPDTVLNMHTNHLKQLIYRFLGSVRMSRRSMSAMVSATQQRNVQLPCRRISRRPLPKPTGLLHLLRLRL